MNKKIKIKHCLTALFCLLIVHSFVEFIDVVFPFQSSSKKYVPELEKYWKAVREDPTDFTGWTYLLQYVDMEVSCIPPRNHLNLNSFLSPLTVLFNQERQK